MTRDTTSRNNAAVLVNPPTCTCETEDGVNLVESVACQVIQLGRSISRNCHEGKMMINESGLFGAQEEQQDEKEKEKEKELEERPISIVPSNMTEAPGGYDVCREYGYKYEYAQDYPSPDATDDGGEEDDDDEEDRTNKKVTKSSTSHERYPLHQSTTVVIPKTQQRIPYIHLLGRTYHPVHDYHAFKQYEQSLFWFTYRWDFPEIAPYGITSDAGWGCMLRSAQMLLAHALRTHFKSKNWRPPESMTQYRQDPLIVSLLTWFADFPSKTESVYSVHNMVVAGYTNYDTIPGEWYGPGKACHVVRDLVQLHAQTQPSLFRVHVSAEGTVYRDAVHALMTQDSKQRFEERQKQTKSSTQSSPLHPLDASIPPPSTAKGPETFEWDTSLLLLVPLRLGLDKFNDDYVDSLARSFWLPQSVGILGGRPRSARWFYGAYADGSKVLGLDPHTVQSAPRRNPQSKRGVHLSNEYLQSIHALNPEIFPLNRMDPSIAIGFYCRDKKEFEALEGMLKELKKDPLTPDLFTFVDRAPDYLSSAMNEMMLGSEIEDDTKGGNKAEEESDEDEYVML